ncbi:hypothetical protein ZIOFF_053395 [Zingiber officinale]|uniref:Uncharacterized protein n=1 Tax=Zingiber officinale TaxID=94328 RepID=A0A8J5FEF4_ZINOF|nr:hypothetical protein ZIOFF_053395 [Zingiber officinale]
MNHCAVQQNALAAWEDWEEMGGSFAVAGADRKHPAICPKHRRMAPLPSVAVPVRPLRRIPSNHLDLLEPCDPEAGAVFPGFLLPKASFFSFPPSKGEGAENSVPSYPSFFCGSPPSRVANPVVFDSRFGEDRPPVPVGHFPAIQSSLSAPILPAQKGCPSAKISYEPARVRIEGFDCLNRDRQRCNSITAVA